MIYIIFIGIFLIVILAAVYYLSTHIYENTSVPHEHTPSDFDIPFTEIRIPTKNSRILYGWQIASSQTTPESAPTLILVHGWNRNLERMMVYIRNLYPEGFNLVTFDARNHGSSDGDEYSTMLKFAEDIISTVDYIHAQSELNLEGLSVLGLSIGGAASIYAASLDPRIQKVVTVGAFAHPRDVMQLEFSRRHIPYLPIGWMIFTMMERRIGRTFASFAPELNIRKSKAAFLLVHGEDDRTVPVEQGRRLRDAGIDGNVRLWVIPGKGHSDCHHESGFWPRLIEFLRQTSK